MPLCSQTCRELTSERFPVLRRVETSYYMAPSSFNLSGMSKEGEGLDLNLFGTHVDIKLPDEPPRSLALHGQHIRDMIAGDTLCKALSSVEVLQMSFCMNEDLVLCHQKTTGIIPVKGQPRIFPRLRRLELHGDRGDLDLSLFNFPALRHLKLDRINAHVRCENFPSMETLECSEGDITLIGEFLELRSLRMQFGTFGADSKFSAPLLQEMSFGSVPGVNILDVGRSTFPSLQFVSITIAAAGYSSWIEEKHIPRLAANAELDRSPRIVLSMDSEVAKFFGKKLPAGVSGWIVLSTVCTLPEHVGLD